MVTYPYEWNILDRTWNNTQSINQLILSIKASPDDISSTIFLARQLIEQRRLGYNHSLYQCNIARALRHHPIHLLPEVWRRDIHSVLTETYACLSKPRFEHSWPWNIPLSWRNLHYQDTATVRVCSNWATWVPRVTNVVHKCETFSNSSMSVFILWFSHFDVDLFRHRHFRFIIVGVNKTNFLYKMELKSMQVADLRRFLQERGVLALFIGNI